MTRWSLDPDAPGPALLHVGRGRGWWWPGRPVVSDGGRLWILGRRRARSVRVGPVRSVWAEAGGLRALLPDGRLAEIGRAELRIRPLRGEVPVPGGGPRIWAADGFLYRQGAPTPLDVLRPGEEVLAGPGGAVLVGGAALDRGALPGRTPAPLPCPLLVGTGRFAPDGRRVAGLDPDGAPRIVDLATGASRPGPDGVPVDFDRHLDPRGRIVAGGRVLRSGLREASCAVWEDRLAGPGGRVWSLTHGRPCSRAALVALGVTAGAPVGFFTADWATHACRWLDRDGRRRTADRTLPLDPDDTPAAARWEDGAIQLETALGERLRVDADGRIGPGDRAVDPAPPVPVPGPGGEPWPADGAVVRGGRRWAWSEDGWLWAWPADQPPSTSEAS